MEYKDLASKKVAVLGVGIEGLALAGFLSGKCQEITLLDKKSDHEIKKYISDNDSKNIIDQIESGMIKTVFGDQYLAGFKTYDIIFRSPGIKYLTEEIQSAKSAGVDISSQIKLFFDLCPCPIIGVTGTKGKGTTASLILEILKKKSEILMSKSETNLKIQIQNNKYFTDSLINSSTNIYLAGNIGMPAISLIGKLKADDIVVLELSSFQLQDLHKSPHIAVVLNISSDHLDYHQNEIEYHEAKLPIVKYQRESDKAIINMDYLASFEFASQTQAETFYFSGKKSVDSGAFIRKIVSTPHSAQVHPESFGLADESSLRGAQREDTALDTAKNNETMKQCGNENTEEVVLRVDGKDEIICRSDKVKLVGHHNLENIAAASLAAYLSGADIISIQETVKQFKGLPHRLELVAEINGVKIYNDSFATNPEPTIAAIHAFFAPKLLILGGSTKGANFKGLAEEISSSNVRAVALIGDESARIKSSLKEANYSGKIIEAGYDLTKAVGEIIKESTQGDIIIFSPACASFDMFKDYKDRGEKFKLAIANLKMTNF